MAAKTTRRHAQGDASRQTILDATLRIAGERGYVGTTMSLVQKETGLPASSLYWHFHSKDDLLMAALDHGWSLWRDQVQPWRDVAESGRLADSLFLNLSKGAAHLEAEPGFWRMGLLLSLESGPAVRSGPRERFAEIRAEALGQLDAWWSKVITTRPEASRVLAQFTLATLDGLFIRHQSEGPGDLQALLRLLAEGLAASAEQIAAGSTRFAPRHDDAVPVPSTPSGPAPVEPVSSRLRFLDAAYQTAAESGYEGATISRICGVAGLPASSLYWHFKDKHDLFAAAVDHSYRQWETSQPTWRPPSGDLSWRDELRSHLLVTAHSLVDQPPFLRLGYLLLLLQRQDSLPGRERFVEVRARRQLLVETWLRETFGERAASTAPDRPKLLSQLLMAAFDGLFFSACLDGGPWEPTVFADVMLCLLPAGIAG